MKTLNKKVCFCVWRLGCVTRRAFRGLNVWWYRCCARESTALILSPAKLCFNLFLLRQGWRKPKKGFYFSLIFWPSDLYKTTPNLELWQQIKVTSTLGTNYSSRTLNVLSVKCHFFTNFWNLEHFVEFNRFLSRSGGGRDWTENSVC